MMKPSDYNGIATGLNKLTEWADTLRAVFEKVEAPIPENEREPGGPTTRRVTTDEARNNAWFKHRWTLLTANENTAKEIAGMMDSCLDGFVVENQGRADNGRAVTTDGRALFDTMSRFLNATDTPIDGAARLYDDVRTRCRDWVGRMTTWFPDLNAGPISGGIAGKTAGTIPGRSAPFVARLIVSDSFKQAVKDGFIPAGITTPPIPWNGNIKELATWLSDSGLLSNPQPDNLTEKTTKWKMADGVFTKDGEPVTNDQLKRAYQR